MTTQTLTPAELANDARAAYEQEDYEKAAQIYEAAADGYAAESDALMAAEMVNNRSVTLLQSGQAQAAFDAIGNSPSVFEQAGDPKRQALALGNRAAAMAALGQREDAESTYWASAKILAEIGEKDLRATVLQSISRLQMRNGRYLEAVASMESGLEQVDKPSLRQRFLKKLLRVPSKMMNS
jgi:tetratricopeptide (TPR) repeat protein